MRERIKKLREQSVTAINTISEERASLITDFYKQNFLNVESSALLRANSFAFIMENKLLYLGDDELIVGERGPSPKACPTYPEICLHSEEDLNILHNRPKVSFQVSETCLSTYRNKIIPYWKGNSNRDKIFEHLPDEWKDAYEAGIFTEFQEQRAPGHTVLGAKMFSCGFRDLIAEIDENISSLDYQNDKQALQTKEYLNSMRICAEAIITYASRYASKIFLQSEKEKDPKRKLELQKMAEICQKVPAYAPESFYEALQHYWFIHLGVITELNPWDSFNPGRLDQHLYPFYIRDIQNGSLSEEDAKELLQAFWIKFNNHPAPPKVGITAQESNTYTDFALINVGGVDAHGNDAVNELSFMILDVVEEMRLLQPSSMVQVSKRNSDRLLRRALKVVRTGFGQPSIFNTDTIIAQQLRQGKSIEDARVGGASGCVETGAFGTEAYILSGYFNLCKVLEICLHNGMDPLSGKKIGLSTGAVSEFSSFDDLFEALSKQIQHFVDIKIGGNNIIDSLYAEYLPVPFLSLLIDDCIQKGLDYNRGGARYNTTYIQGVGLGSITDMLTAIRYNVFDNKFISLSNLLAITQLNFYGCEEWLLRLRNNTPKYGNDNDYADKQACMIFDALLNAVEGKSNIRGGVHRINMLPTTCHVYFGSKIGGSCDGRLAFEPLSEGISPFQGMDRNGPVAVIKSASKIDHIKTGGTLLNQKFCPELLDSDEKIDHLCKLIRTYFRLDGHHIQFNIVDSEMLRKAQKDPEKYSDLIVRVAGYSDYFNDLGESLQNEIIRRTEHKDFS
ncbi:MAG: trans-4-hydroxy-L-proline dehydratase [Bacteroidales bacterium]